MLALAAIPALSSCEMEQFPTTVIPNEESWTRFNDAQKFNIGIKSLMRGISTQQFYATDFMVDYYQPGAAFGNRNGLVYSWEFQAEDVGGAWSSNYNYIINCNNFLNNCDGLEWEPASIMELEKQEKSLKQFKAEAYFLRAWAYFNMAIRYCKDYNAATADSDLGLPLVTDVDINGKPARSSVAATYAFILQDLDSALEHVQATENNTDVVTEQVIKALKARVALAMNNNQLAYDLATEVISNEAFELLNAAEYEKIWTSPQGSKETVFAASSSSDERSSDWSGTVQQFSSAHEAYSPDMIPSTTTLNDYAAQDIRRTMFFMEGSAVEDKGTGTILMLDKFKNNPELGRKGDSQYVKFCQPAGIRTAELYLIAAEAAYQLNDATNAEKYLNDLRTARNAAAFGSATGGTDLFAAIKLEWKREFIGEGQRLFCLKRWNEGFQRDRTAMQVPALIFQNMPDQFIGLTVTPDNKRWVWEIPTNDLETNANLVANW